MSWRGVEVGDVVRFRQGNSPMVVDRIYRTSKGVVRFRTHWPRRQGTIRVDASNTFPILNLDLVSDLRLFDG